MFYTAQYRYPGADRLDITVKGNDPIGNVFAPTWAMVSAWMAAKKKGPSELIAAEKLYRRQYLILMLDSVKVNHAIWLEVLNRPEVTLVCFCPANTFCHRYQLAEMFQAMGNIYEGERQF